jgi:hypothetical protein
MSDNNTSSKQFIENESYKHKSAKQILKGWFDDSDISDGACQLGDIYFRHNWEEGGVLLEYPICKFNDGTDSWNYNVVWNFMGSENCITYQEIIPTYQECVNDYNSHPIAIIDIVCCHKGSPKIGIEICHKNPVSQEKIKKLKEFGVEQLIEIDADWILNQVKMPSQLKYKTLI